MRISVDTGGTFTDLVLEESTGRLQVFKAPTTPEEPASGIFAALETAARHRGERVGDLLGQCELFIHATTLAINAVLTGSTARTAYLATEGHPDTLLFREGGRIEIFNFTVEYPDPYVPRALTFQVPERIGADGAIVSPLDETATVEIISKLDALDVEAVAVCLLWSTVNPAHELRIGELLARHLPDVPFTLSHQLNLIPQVGAVLSAAGALMAELGDDFAATHPTGSKSFDFDGVNTVLETLGKRAAQMVEDLALPPSDTEITFSAEARYAHQVWEIEIELRAPRFETRADVDALVEDFHAEHEQVFAVRDPDSEVEVIHWHARVRSRIRQRDLPPVQDPVTPAGPAARRVVFPGYGPVEAAVVGFASLAGTPCVGPAVVESPFTSVAIEPGVEFQRAGSGGLRVRLPQMQSEQSGLAAKSW